MKNSPRFWKIDKELQRWFALLEAELVTWPQVTSKPMFGMIGFYCGAKIFALIPRTKAAGSERSLLVKLAGIGVSTSTRRTSSWSRFELESEKDLAPALEQLQRAYQKVKRGKQ